MKWLAFVLPFIIGKLNKADSGPSRFSPEAIFDDVTYKSRKVVALTLGGVIAVVLLCSGLMMSITDATAQYDRNGVIYFTATFNTGLVLAAIAAVCFAAVFGRAWPGVREHRAKHSEDHSHKGFFSKPPPPKAHASSLETAISALILDFVRERESRRNARTYANEQQEFRRGKAFEQEQPPVYHS